MTEQKLPNIPGELTEDDLRRVTAGFSETFDKTEKEIEELCSRAQTSGYTKSEFLEEAQGILAAATGLSSTEIATLESLILTLATWFPG